jgi:transglutaminase-like putative cysteine protease/putative Mn2+ efflux pump MntP
MGVIIFVIATITGIYVANYFRRSLLDLPNGGSNRTPINLNNIPVTNPEPIVANPIIQAPILDRSLSSNKDRVLFNTSSSTEFRSEVLPNLALPTASIEESGLFRVLVYGMMVLSTIGIDLFGGTHYGWMSMLIMAIGSGWSWYRRYYVKHWLNWLGSIVMSAILICYAIPILVKDVQAEIDRASPALKTQIAVELTLGLIIVGLLMGLSFHLYSRKMLGYCMMMSCVSIGIAASLSHNLNFLILLCGFVAIGIPTLMLDYRSRLNLSPIGIVDLPINEQLSYQHLPWQYLTKLAGMTLGIGLILSLFLPNFHFPNLSFQPEELEKLTALAPKDRLSQPNPKSSPSSQPQIDPNKIVPKLLGQPGNNNYPDPIKQDNLKLSPEIASRFQDFTQQVLKTSPQPLDSDYHRAAYLAQYLKQHHQTSAQPSTLTDSKPIEQLIAPCQTNPTDCKLVGNKQDLPILYTSMLRSIDIPARLKMDDKLVELDAQTQTNKATSASTQSQTEVYFPNWGWFKLDPTPDRPLFDLDQRQIAQLQQQSPAPSPSSTPESFPNNSTPTPSPSAPTSPSTFELPQWELDPNILKICIIAIAVCGCMIWYLLHQQKEKQQLANLAPVEQIYRSMLNNLSKAGITKHPAQTQLEYAQSINNIYHPQIVKVTQEMSQLYTAWRYGKKQIDVRQLAKKLRYLQYLQQLATKKQRQRKIAKFKSQWWK